jgi:hypothetical protein
MIEALRLRNEDADRRDDVLGVGAMSLRKGPNTSSPSW